MANSYKKLYQGQPTNSAATIYTVGASTQTIIKHIRAANATSTDRTLKLYRGGTADTNLILPAVTIPANGWAEWDGSMALDNNETIAAVVSVSSTITVTIDGLEIT